MLTVAAIDRLMLDHIVREFLAGRVQEPMRVVSVHELQDARGDDVVLSIIFKYRDTYAREHVRFLGREMVATASNAEFHTMIYDRLLVAIESAKAALCPGLGWMGRIRGPLRRVEATR